MTVCDFRAARGGPLSGSWGQWVMGSGLAFNPRKVGSRIQNRIRFKDKSAATHGPSKPVSCRLSSRINHQFQRCRAPSAGFPHKRGRCPLRLTAFWS
jgi:hypothetical protein